MIPILYDKAETNFFSNGIGRLSDAISCIVTEERNGAFTLEMDYPITGEFYSAIELNSIIKAAPNDTDNDQLFFVYSIVRYMGGYATILARHISYRLSGIPIKPFTATGAANAMAGLVTNAVTAPGFTFETNISSSAQFKLVTPQTCKACLGGVDQSILDVFGGEYKWDNFKVSLLSQRGEDNGVTIQYGKNLTDLKVSEDTNETYNGVFPFWYREGEGVVYPSSASVNTAMSYPYPFYELEDMTQNYSSMPTATQLKNRADTEAGHLSMPAPIINFSFIALWNMAEYDLIAKLEKLKLCDYVTVNHYQMGVSVKSIVIKTVYNVLIEKYQEVSIGAARSDLYETLSNLTNDMSESATKGDLSGFIATKSVSIGTVTLAAGASSSVSSTTDIDVSGYYALELIRCRSSEAGISFSNGSLSRNASSTTVNYTCRNNTGSSITATIRAIILYMKPKYIVTL